MGQMQVNNMFDFIRGSVKTQTKKGADSTDNDFKALLKDKPEDLKEVDSQPVSEEEENKEPENVQVPGNAEELLTTLQMGQMIAGVQTIQDAGQAANHQEQTAVESMPVETTAVKEILAADNGQAAVVQTAGAEVNTEEVPAVKSGPEQGVVQGQNTEPESPDVPVTVQAEETTGSQDEPQAGNDTLARTAQVRQNDESRGQTDAPEAGSAATAQAVQQPVETRADSIHRTVETRQSHTETMYVTQPEEIPDKLAAEMASKIASGVNEFEIQIEPEHLGKIAIKLLYEGGQAMISIICSEKSTHEMVAHHARDLGNIMEQNLGSSTTVYVEKQENDHLAYGENENDHTARESEQDRQREEQEKRKPGDGERFLHELRLGLMA